MGFLSRFLGHDEAGPSAGDAAAPLAASDAVTAAGSASASPAPQLAASAPGAPAADSGFDFGALTKPAPAASAPAPTFVEDSAVTRELTPKIVEVLKTVFDPEIPIDIYELGLIYDISADVSRQVRVKMTLTSPACPSAQQIPSEVQYKVKAVEGVADAAVDVVWEPPWDKDRMSDTAKISLGIL